MPNSGKKIHIADDQDVQKFTSQQATPATRIVSVGETVRDNSVGSSWASVQQWKATIGYFITDEGIVYALHMPERNDNIIKALLGPMPETQEDVNDYVVLLNQYTSAHILIPHFCLRHVEGCKHRSDGVFEVMTTSPAALAGQVSSHNGVSYSDFISKQDWRAKFLILASRDDPGAVFTASVSVAAAKAEGRYIGIGGGV